MKVTFKYPNKCAPKLDIDESVAERVYGTVQITQPVRNIVQNAVLKADQGKNMPRGPTKHKRT